MQQVEEAVEETVEVKLEEATTEQATPLEEVEAQPTETQTEPEKDESDEEEIAEYSESVKKRINKLTYKIREAERREQAAIEYAKGVQEKLNSTQATLTQKDQNLYDEYSARVDSQLSAAEDRYKQAHEIGDTEAMLNAQKEVAKLAVEQESLTRVKPEPQETPVEVPQVDQQAQQQVQQEVAPDPKAQEWAAKNEWFGEDLAMTTSAFAFHRQLVEQGVGASIKEFLSRYPTFRSGGKYITSARGGIKFTGAEEGLAMLHRGEFVVPEPGQMPQAVQRTMGMGNGGITININASVVESNAVDELVRQIERRFQTFGSSTSPLFGGT